MSVKFFCDCCEREIGRNAVSRRYRPAKYMNGRNFAAEVVVRVGVTWNDGHLCLDCLKKLLLEPDCELGEREGGPS